MSEIEGQMVRAHDVAETHPGVTTVYKPAIVALRPRC